MATQFITSSYKKFVANTTLKPVTYGFLLGSCVTIIIYRRDNLPRSISYSAILLTATVVSDLGRSFFEQKYGKSFKTEAISTLAFLGMVEMGTRIAAPHVKEGFIFSQSALSLAKCISKLGISVASQASSAMLKLF